MQKSSSSRPVYQMWLRRFWVGGALMLVVFILAAVVYGSALSSVNYQMMGPAELEAMNGRIPLFISEAAISGLITLFVMGASLVACLLCFQYIQQPKAATMLHSLPHTRQHLYLSVSGAGMTLLLGPLVLSALLFGLAMALNGLFSLGPLLVYLLTMISVAVLTFGVVSFTGMLTGTTIAQAIFAVVLVNAPVLVESAILSYCDRFLFGFETGMPLTTAINPFAAMDSYLTQLASSYAVQDPIPLATPIVFILVGVLFWLAGLLLYRVRQLECAGDVIALRVLRPVFSFGMALAGATAFSGCVEGFFGNGAHIVLELVFGLIGGALLYALAQMLMRRTVRVARYCKGALAFGAVYLVLVLALYTDLIGYGSYRLNPDEVEFITVGYSNDRVEAAMTGGSLHGSYIYEDLQLDDPTGYLGKMAMGDTSPMPPALARQILQQDPRVFKGAGVQTAVAFQNMLANHASELKHTNSTTALAYSDQQRDKVQHYYIQVQARLKSGQTFERYYRFVLGEGQFPDIAHQWQLLGEQNALGQAEYALGVARVAKHVVLEYHYNDFMAEAEMPRTHAMSHTLNPGEWDGLYEAYVQDVQAGANQAVSNDPYASPILDLTALVDDNVYYRSDHISVGLEHTRTLQWLKEHNLLSEAEITAQELWRQYLEEEGQRYW